MGNFNVLFVISGLTSVADPDPQDPNSFFGFGGICIRNTVGPGSGSVKNYTRTGLVSLDLDSDADPVKLLYGSGSPPYKSGYKEKN